MIELPCVVYNYERNILRIMSHSSVCVIYMAYFAYRCKIIIYCDVCIVRYDNAIALINVIRTN